MALIISFILVLSVLLVAAPSAHAIIFLPALILIPIAKIVALIIGGFSVPALGIGTIWGKMAGKPVLRIVIAIVVVLVLVGIVLAIALKIHNPDRPLF